MGTFTYKSAIELADMIRKGEATSEAIVKEHIDRINEHNDNLNAVVIKTFEEALKEARTCDVEAQNGKFRGPLHGVPMTIKEQFWIKGLKSTNNVKMFKDFIAPEDAILVERIRKSGAIILGKTNVPRNLLDFQVWGDIYPDGKNPYNTERTPGGSSGGSSSALASGMVPIELGGDFGGSIRNPCNFCGLYGLKPTDDSLPGHGLTPVPKGAKGFIFHMAQAGPMARDIDDLELLWDILAGPDKRERRVPRIDYRVSSNRKLKDYKIAWVDEWPGFPTGRQIKEAMKDLVQKLESNGVEVINTGPENSLHEESLALWMRLFPQLICQDMPAPIRPLIKWDLKRTMLKGFKKFKKEFNKGFKLSFINYSETMGIRSRIISGWESFFESFDFLLCPAAYGPAYKRCKLGDKIKEDGKEITYLEYVWPFTACFNGSGHPGMNIPLGLNNEGLPLGVQLVGPYWSEKEMIHFVRQLSDLIPGFVRPKGYRITKKHK
jgi:amidase